jgi:butyrate kinase
MYNFRILTINPGSTSTKVALFEGQNKLFSKNIEHDLSRLSHFSEISEQFDYRKQMILETVEENNIDFETIDAFSGRGGGLVSLEGGTYEVNPMMLKHARIGLTVKHPATLGCQIAHYFAEKYNKKAFVVNPPDVDEFQDVARLTGLKGVYRESRTHALNQKEVAIRYAKSIEKKYEELNLIIAHIGGGISITAHQKGRMIDSNDIVSGDGPMAPTRCGSIPVKNIVEMSYSGKYSEREMLDKITKSGGISDHLGTADIKSVIHKIERGDAYAKLVFEGMLYQIVKEIGAYAAVLKGEVDAIILTGGIAQSAYVVNTIKSHVQYIGQVIQMAGEFEMEALAAGAIRVLAGEEKAKIYTGEPIWNGFI